MAVGEGSVKSRLKVRDKQCSSIPVSCHRLARTWDLPGQCAGVTWASSSSGGGLFGRPVTRMSQGALLNFWGNFLSWP